MSKALRLMNMLTILIVVMVWQVYGIKILGSYTINMSHLFITMIPQQNNYLKIKRTRVLTQEAWPPYRTSWITNYCWKQARGRMSVWLVEKEVSPHTAALVRFFLASTEGGLWHACSMYISVIWYLGMKVTLVNIVQAERATTPIPSHV